MTRPDRPAVITAVPAAAAAAITGTAAWISADPILWLFAGIAAAYTVTVLAVFWRRPLVDDVMAVADATREQPPGQFDEWERELTSDG